MFSFLKIVLQYWNTSDGALKNINNIYMYNNQNNVATFETETHSQQQSQTTPSAPSIPSPGKLRILQRNENTSSLTPKNGVSPSVQNMGVTNEDLNHVIQLIQNTVQALTMFEKQFLAHKDNLLNKVANL